MLLAGTTPCFVSEFMAEAMACSLTRTDPPYLFTHPEVMAHSGAADELDAPFFLSV